MKNMANDVLGYIDSHCSLRISEGVLIYTSYWLSRQIVSGSTQKNWIPPSDHRRKISDSYDNSRAVNQSYEYANIPTLMKRIGLRCRLEEKKTHIHSKKNKELIVPLLLPICGGLGLIRVDFLFSYIVC
jgi:hypothetical protein